MELTSMNDPFDFGGKEEITKSHCPSDIRLAALVDQAGGGSELPDALSRLGVRSPADLAFVTPRDLVEQGVSLVAARRLLANCPSEEPSKLEDDKSLAKPVAVPAAPLATFNAEETMKLLTKKGSTSGDREAGQIMCSSFLGGALLGWGCCLTVAVAGGTSPILASAPGLLSLLTGAVFPVGLSMVVLSGSELLTGNFVTMALPAWGHPGVNKEKLLGSMWRVWWMSGVGNLLGSLFVVYSAFLLSVVQAGSPAALWLAGVTVKKCSLGLWTAIGKGACANWLVNVAIFQASSAHTAAGKIAALWLPIMTFVTLGLEHSVANMFFLPLGLLLGADVSWLNVAGNILPVAVGNAIGAIIFVAGMQRYSLLRGLAHAKPA